MNRLAALTALAALALSCNARATGSIAEVTILDRDTGAQLTAHYYHGEYWVAGRPGDRYAIEIRNHDGGRVLAVTSVDGVNVISGENAAWDQTGYVFGPRQSYEITGWRKSNAEVASFTFTDLPNSYAARTGRPANVGIIGVALFREQPPRRFPPYMTQAAPAREAGDAAASEPNTARGADSRAERESAAGSVGAPAAKLGTGHGEREQSYVEDTEFQRLQKEPNEVIRIRYDSEENLIAMGVLRRPRPVLPGPNPFPDSPARQFVPDPPG